MSATSGIFHQSRQEFFGSEKLCLDGAEWDFQFPGDFVVGQFLKKAEFNHQSVFGTELTQVAPHEHELLVADVFFLRVEVAGAQVVGVVLIAVHLNRVVDRKHIQFFLSDKINTIIDSYLEEPGAKGISWRIGAELAESFAKSFKCEVVRVFSVVYHFQHHIENGFFVAVHQFRISAFFLILDGTLNDFIVFNCSVG